MITPVIVVLLTFYGIERDINYGLPSYIHKEKFGIINGLYVILRVVAPSIIAIGIWGLIEWRLVFVGIGMYVFAYGIKILVWRYAYGINILSL